MIKSSEWCVDCWVEPDANDGEGKGKGKEEISSDKRRGREGRGLLRRWTGYRGVRGRECWRDDVPQ